MTYRQPLRAFWRAVELRETIDRMYSQRIWEARREIAFRVMTNAAIMGSASRFDPERLPA